MLWIWLYLYHNINVQYANVCVGQAHLLVCGFSASLFVRGLKSWNSDAIQEVTKRPHTDASRSWIWCHLSSSGLLWDLPAPWTRCQKIYSQRPALACLISFPLSATTIRPQAFHYPWPGVINVVLIFQSLASPFYLNLIKAASCLLPANSMLEWERAGQPRLAWCRHMELELQQRNLSSMVSSKGQEEVEILSNIKRLSLISIIRPYVLQISCRISCWCTGLKWHNYYSLSLKSICFIWIMEGGSFAFFIQHRWTRVCSLDVKRSESA